MKENYAEKRRATLVRVHKTTETSEAFVYVAMSRLMVRRLARS
jgi:hypothetical protein